MHDIDRVRLETQSDFGMPALKAEHATALRVETIDSDHSFNDRRIALQTVVLGWLATLNGAPPAK